MGLLCDSIVASTCLIENQQTQKERKIERNKERKKEGGIRSSNACDFTLSVSLSSHHTVCNDCQSVVRLTLSRRKSPPLDQSCDLLERQLGPTVKQFTAVS